MFGPVPAAVVDDRRPGGGVHGRAGRRAEGEGPRPRVGIMDIVAIDPGTKTGWASWVRGFLESGVQEFSLKRGESAGMRFIRFRAWLKDLIKAVGPDLIVYEQAHLRGGWATDLLVGMTTRICEDAAAAGIEMTSVHSATLKKAIAGTGRADKLAMMKAAARLYPGRRIQDDNEADALCLLAWARQTLGGGRP